MIVAYLDPTNVTLIVQSIVAAAVAVPFIFRSQVARGIRMIRRIARPEIPEDRAPDDE